MLLTAALLVGQVVLTPGAAPAAEPNSSHLTIVGYGTEATLHPGQSVTGKFEVRCVGTENYVDVSCDPNTTYAIIPAPGGETGTIGCPLSGCATAAAVGKSVTLYAIYTDPQTGVQTTATAPVVVVK